MMLTLFTIQCLFLTMNLFSSSLVFGEVLEGVNDNILVGYSMHHITSWNKASTRTLFNSSYSSESVTNGEGNVRMFPDWYNVNLNPSCGYDSQSSSIISESSTEYYYQKSSARNFGYEHESNIKLSVSAGPAAASGSTNVRNAAMFGGESTSAYHRAQSQSKRTKSVEIRAIDVDYTITIDRSITISDLNSQFVTDAQNLENSFSSAAANLFIEYYGTHYIYKAEMGGFAQMGFIFDHTYTNSEVTNAVSSITNNDFGFLFFSSSQSSQTSASTTISSGETVTYSRSSAEILGGADDVDSLSGWCSTFRTNPIPTKVELRPITELLEIANVNTATRDLLWSYISERIGEITSQVEGICLLSGCHYSYEACVGGSCQKTDLDFARFWTHEFYQEDEMYCSVPTNYPDLDNNIETVDGYCGGFDIKRNDVDSLTIPEGAKLTAWTYQGYSQGWRSFCDDSNDLNKVFGRNDVDSLKAYPIQEGATTTGCVDLYSHENYQGTHVQVCPSYDAEHNVSVSIGHMDTNSIGINNLDSIKIPDGWMVELYAYDNFDKTNDWYTLCDSSDDLDRNDWGRNDIDSFKLEDYRLSSDLSGVVVTYG